MKEVRIAKLKLIEILTKNRADHRDIFLAAQKKYRDVAIDLLDEQLKLAQVGKPFVLAKITMLAAPEDHTRDYDKALKMLDLSEDEVITLTSGEFTNLVEDLWAWSRSWAASNSRYTNSPKFADIEDMQ